VLYVRSIVSDGLQLTPDSLQAALARIVGSVAALATNPYDEWLQDVQGVQDAARGHVMAKSLTPDPFPFVPEVDYLDAPAPTNGHEHSPSPPTQTIDPKLLRLPSPPAPSKPEARSIVREYIASADWLSADAEEPNVGDPGVPPCASLLADDGSPIFRCLIDQIKQQGVTKYKCADCKHIIDRIDRALEHQRSKLHYKPFSCPAGW